MGCSPKLYVYDIPNIYRQSLSLTMWPGVKMKLHPQIQAFSINQYAIPAIIYNRSLAYICRVTDPNDADLFYIPAFNMNKKSFSNSEIHEKTDTLIDILNKVKNKNGMSFLEIKHGTDHFIATGFQGRPPATTVNKQLLPLSSELLSINDNRLGGTVSLTMDITCHTWLSPNHRSDIPWSTLESTFWSIPYPTAIHYDKKMWDWHHHERNTLVYAAFDKVHTSHKSPTAPYKGAQSPLGKLRTNLLSQCEKVSYCKDKQHLHDMNRVDHAKSVKTYKFGIEKASSVEKHILQSYFNSIFCLQPFGDRYARKGMIDSLLMGCIPVFFHKQSLINYPWHWKDWIENSSVLIQDVTENKINVMKYLSSIHSDEISQMQRVIRQNAHKLSYSLHDYDFPDAYKITLQNMHARAKYANTPKKRVLHPTCIEYKQHH
jgi:hypothetical protein